MEPEKQALLRAWISKATSDLETARLLITGEERHLDTGVYHCHQCAEKILKALLTAEDILFPKMHSIVELVALIQPQHPEIMELTEHAANLTPLATEFRYPGDLFEPPLDDALLALRYAQEVFSLVQSLLLPPDRDGKPAA